MVTKLVLVPMVKAFRERNEFVTNAINAVNGLACMKGEGAFYAFVDAREGIKNLAAAGKIKEANDMEMTAYLLEAGVAVVPGSAFGAEGYFRVSFATSMENLEKACERIAKAFA